MKTGLSVSVLFITVWNCGIAKAEFGDELQLYRSNDAMSADEFGYSVNLDGQIGIYGAPGRHEIGPQSGAAYIFDVTTGEQLMKLIPEDGAAEDRFGVSVAVHENIAVVGAIHADPNGMSSGAAYLFDIHTGQQLHKLLGDSTVAGDEFGISVDIDDGIAIVGAHFHNEGLAYLFDVESGNQIGTLLSNDASPGDLFGVAVALDGNTALVGARYDDELGTAAGSAYLFDISSGEQLHKLNAHDGYWGDRFGMYVDVDGNTAIVASRYDDDVLKSSGSAYLFNVDDGQERFKIVAEDADPNDHFGSSVSVSGDLAIVGAANDRSFGNFSGSAYVFDVNSGKQLTKLNSSDPGFFQQFGTAVAIDGDLAIVGSSELIFAETADGMTSGRGFTYDLTVVPEPKLCPLSLALCFAAFLRRRPMAS